MFEEAANHLMQIGKAKQVYILAIHGVFSGDSLLALDSNSNVHQIIVSNTIEIPEEKLRSTSKLVIIDISQTLSEGIRRLHNGESMSYLFHSQLSY